MRKKELYSRLLAAVMIVGMVLSPLLGGGAALAQSGGQSVHLPFVGQNATGSALGDNGQPVAQDGTQTPIEQGPRLQASAALSCSESCVGFPDSDPDSGRFVNVTRGLQTLGDVGSANFANLHIRVPKSLGLFQLSIFDADVGGLWDDSAGILGLNTVFRLYPDPNLTRNVSDGVVLEYTPSTASDDDTWVNLTNIANGPALAGNANGPLDPCSASGDFCIYHLVAEWVGLIGLPNVQNNFKVAVEGTPFLLAGSTIGFQGLDASVASALYRPTSYMESGGTFDFFIEVPGPINSMDLWDGDMDHAADTDDLNSVGIPVFAELSPSVLLEGALIGQPLDDSMGDEFRVSPNVFYTIQSPDASWTATNNNPSGNKEWEVFRVVTAGSGISDADVVLQPGQTMPAGSYRWRLQGLDNQNTVFVTSQYNLLPPANVCVNFVTLDFEKDALGNILTPGTVIDNEYADWGLTFARADSDPWPLMLFNADDPTGGDTDLEFPGMGNILILSEDGDSSDPDDDGGGGVIRMTSTAPFEVRDITILDIDEDESGSAIAFDAVLGGSAISTAIFNNLGNNTLQQHNLAAQGARRLDITFSSSGAVGSIDLCLPDAPPPPCVQCEDGVDSLELEISHRGSQTDLNETIRVHKDSINGPILYERIGQSSPVNTKFIVPNMAGVTKIVVTVKGQYHAQETVKAVFYPDCELQPGVEDGNSYIKFKVVEVNLVDDGVDICVPDDPPPCVNCEDAVDSLKLEISHRGSQADLNERIRVRKDSVNGALLFDNFRQNSPVGTIYTVPGMAGIGKIVVTVQGINHPDEYVKAVFYPNCELQPGNENGNSYIKFTVVEVNLSTAGPICTTGGSLPTDSQLPWLENFNNLSNGATNDNGETAWSIDTTGAKSTASVKVYDNKFKMEDSGVGVGWNSQPISRGSSGPICVSLNVKSQGDMEDASNASAYDWFRVYVKINGGDAQLLQAFDSKINNNSSQWQPVSHQINGSTVQVILRSRTTAAGEVYWFDDVLIKEGSCDSVAILSAPDLPWQESFPLNNGATSDNGTTAWSVNTSGMNGSGKFRVYSNQFEISDTGAEVRWESETIDISGTPANISLKVRSSGDMENSGSSHDWFDVYYVLNGGTPQLIQDFDGKINNNNGFVTVFANGLSGSTLKILIKSRISTGGEYYYFDDVKVMAGQAVMDPWQEHFPLDNYTKSDNGSTAWSLKTSGMNSNARFYVYSNQFEVSNTGAEVSWESQTININGAPASLALKVRSYGDMESSGGSHDWFRVYYVLNGGSPQLVQGFNGKINNNSSSFTTVNANGISGSTLKIIVKTRISTSGEYYYFDAVTVQADNVSGFAAEIEEPNEVLPEASNTDGVDNDPSGESEVDPDAPHTDGVDADEQEGSNLYLPTIQGITGQIANR